MAVEIVRGGQCRHILKVYGTGFHGSLHMGYEQKRGDKFDAGVFVPSNCKKGVVINLNKGS